MTVNDHSEQAKAKNRPLKEINHLLLKESSILETTLSGLCAGNKRKPIKVLEVGFGYGRALMELAYGFRNLAVDFHGITLPSEKKPPLTNSGALIDIAVHYGVASRENFKNIPPPTIYFYDATNLHFENEKLDFIYSVVTVRFMTNKARFLEEVCRVLRPGGIALLHLGESRWDYPHGLASKDKQLTSYTSRFILKYGQELIPLPDYLRLFDGKGFKFQFLETSRCVLKITKVDPGQLDFQLKLNPDFSAPMREFLFENTNRPRRGGFRTVYDVSPDKYQELIEKGLVEKLENLSQ
ncbi:MAG: class I SAM-dependent methyltransferase [Nitrospinaceae bacterium]